MFNQSLTRRAWLKHAAAIAAASAVGGCATRQGWHVDDYRRPLSTRPFSRPHIDMDAIIRTRVGLRPFRAAGFVVRGEKFGDKLIIHNYGHGGGGITLSWGSSALAVRELPDSADRRAAVLGCGVMGLSTARLLQARGWQVTIYAKDLPPNTTSNVAGGQWAPTSVFRAGSESPEFAVQFNEALRLSHLEFSKLVGRGVGVNWQENYHLSREPVRPEDNFYLRGWPDLFPEIAVLAPHQHPFPAPYAMRHLTMLIEPAIYLSHLMQEFVDAGGKLVVQEMRELPELLALREPVIFNCTGLGSRELFRDEQLTPVRGQLVFMPADERVDYTTHGSGDGLLYMFPRADGILLGGTFERGATHLEPDADTTARIVTEHARMFASMRV